jgi:hypothetical protein
MKLNTIIESIVKEYLNEEIRDTTQDIMLKYSEKDVMFHCTDNIIDSFDLKYVKGGVRANYGWGMYFASTPFKASDYGKYCYVVSKSNLNLLPLDTKISDEFIKKIEPDISGFKDVIKLINTNGKYENLYDYNIQKFSDLEFYKKKFLNILFSVKNNREYDEISSLISNIDELLTMKKNDNTNYLILDTLNKNLNKTFYDLIIYVFNNYSNEYDKKLSLFFKKIGYDGFNYRDNEYVIFNTDNLKILERIKIR